MKLNASTTQSWQKKREKKEKPFGFLFPPNNFFLVDTEAISLNIRDLDVELEKIMNCIASITWIVPSSASWTPNFYNSKSSVTRIKVFLPPFLQIRVNKALPFRSVIVSW